MKSVSRPFLIAIIVCGFALAGVMHFGTVQASTEVAGIITSDTTWTLENSPYIITATVQIPENIVLTIDPGVTVIFSGDGDMFLVHGAIYAHGTVDNKITFEGKGTTNIFNAEARSALFDLEYCTIKDGGKVWRITGGTAQVILRYSELVNITSYSQFSHIKTDNYIEYNIFVNAAGIRIYDWWDSDEPALRYYIRHNLIKGNRDFFVECTSNRHSTEVIVKYNSFIDPSGTFLQQGGNYVAINAIENYWGTSNTSLIDLMIHDANDDINSPGVIEYLPILTEPHPDTPTPPEPTPALPTYISISVDASSTVVGSAVNVNGKLTDINGSALHGKSITLSYSITGNEWVPIGSGTTNAAGEYNIQWVNTASGTFTLKAEWAGNDEYLGANVNTTLGCLSYENQKFFFVESNSTVSALSFNNTNIELSFTVSGASGTTGYVKATIPKDLLYTEGDWIVLVDEQPVSPTVNEDTNNTYIHFTYGHSTKTIEIIGTYAIPEFPSWIILPLFLTATLFAIVIKKRCFVQIHKQVTE